VILFTSVWLRPRGEGDSIMTMTLDEIQSR
jgi:hypothetical protein